MVYAVLNNFIMSGNIEPTGLSGDDRRYIRKVSLNTILKFFNAEVIGFGFGVPLATIIGIGYSKISMLHFWDVYFIPILVTTFVVVVFIAFPTNAYLIRGLFKCVFQPSVANLREFSFSVSRIPLVASINLFFRIVFGGVIVNIWVLIVQGSVDPNVFVITILCPTFGGWVAAAVYFFVLQNVLAGYNLKVRKFITLTKRSELLKLRPLSMRVVYPLFLSLTLFMFSGLIVFGEIVGAELWGRVLVGLSTVVVVCLIIITSYISMKKVIDNINHILLTWEESKEQLGLYGLYDVEEVVREVYQLQVFSFYIDDILKRLLEEAKGIPEKILSSMKVVFFGVENFRNRLTFGGIRFIDYQNFKKETSEMNAIVRECIEKSEKIVGLINSMNVSFVSSEELVKGNGNIRYMRNLEEEITRKTGELSKESIEVEKEVKRVLNLSDEIISKIEVIERYSKEMEMIFINFQLEMAKVGYPMEFRFISVELGKLLERMEEISREIRGSLDNFKSMVKEMNTRVKNIIISYDSEALMFSDIVGKMREVYGVFEEMERNFKEIVMKVRELKVDVNVLNNVLSEMGIIIGNISKVYNLSKEIEGVPEEVSSILNELQKLASSHSEKVKVIGKILNAYVDVSSLN